MKTIFVTKTRKVGSEKISFFVERPIFTGENNVLTNERKLGLDFNNEVTGHFVFRSKDADLLIFTRAKTTRNID